MNVLRLALFEFTHLLRMRTVLIMMLLLPLLLILILGTALSGDFKADDSMINKVKVALFNADEGPIKESIEQFFKHQETQQYIEPVAADSKEAVESMIRESKVHYGVVIPAVFSAKVMQGKAAEWELYPGRSITNNFTVESVLRSYVQHVNNIQAITIVMSQRTASEANHPSQFATHDGNSRVEIGSLLPNKRQSSAIQYYSAAYLIMFLLYSGMSAAMSILGEKEAGTWLRLYSLPIPPVQILLGKLLGNSIYAVLQATVIIGATKFAYGVEWGGHWLYLILVCLLTITAAMSLGFTFAMWFKTSKAVESVYSMLVIMMTFLSGGMIPNLGERIERIGQFTINHWAADSVVRLMLGGSNETVLHNMQILGYIALGLLLIASLSLRRATDHE